MTTAQMISAFEVGYDIANLEGPGYEDTEKIILLNQAQVIEVLKELNLKRLIFISNLIVNEQGTLAAGLNYSHSATFNPAQEYIGYISSKSKVTRATFKVITVAEWIENIQITKDESGKYITNTLNKPILLQPRVFDDATGNIIILRDVYTTFSGTNDFYLEYVRKPTDIATGVNCEVNPILHERIVSTAVDLAKKVFNPNEAGASVQTGDLLDKPQL